MLSLLSRRGDGRTPGEITRALQITKSGLTNTLHRLTAGKLVRIEGSADDGRMKRIWLTAEGHRTYALSLAGLRPKIERLRQAFPRGELRDALPFLRALRAWLDGHP